MTEFNCTREELDIISKMMDRVEARVGKINRMPLMMDIEACHSNGCKLKLQELLESDNSSFMSDLNGIQLYVNRKTGKLDDGFLPKYAA